MEIIPEDDEFFSTDVKYRFEFDKDIILQSNAVEICEAGDNLENKTKSIEEMVLTISEVSDRDGQLHSNILETCEDSGKRHITISMDAVNKSCDGHHLMDCNV